MLLPAGRLRLFFDRERDLEDLIWLLSSLLALPEPLPLDAGCLIPGFVQFEA
jgi:hypothetical protein